MFNKVSIFSFLVLQAFCSIFLLLILGVVSYFAREDSLAQQRVLTDVVIPLQEKIQMNQRSASETVIQMNRIGLTKSLEEFIDCQKSQLDVSTMSLVLQEIEKIVKDSSTYILNEKELSEFSSYNKDANDLITITERIIQKLRMDIDNLQSHGMVYANYLKESHTNNDILIRAVSKLDDTIKASIADMDSLSGKVRFAFKKQIRSIKKKLKSEELELDSALKSKIKGALFGNSSQIQNRVAKLAKSLLLLQKVSWQLVSSTNSDQIVSIKNNEIVQIIDDRNSHIEYLKNNLSDNKKLMKKLLTLEESVKSLDGEMVSNENSIYNLKLQFIKALAMAKEKEAEVKIVAESVSFGYKALISIAHILKSKVKISLELDGVKQTKVLSSIGIFAIFLAALIAAIVTRRISIPLNKTVEAAKQLALGNVDQTLVKHNDDEFGQLTDSFNNLIETQKNRANIVEEVAQGDLSVSIQPASNFDKLGMSLDDMINSLNNLVYDVLNVSQNVNCSSESLERSNGEINDQLVNQASCMEEISASIVDIGSEGSKVAEIASNLNEFGFKLKQVADNGGKAMGEIVGAMQNIKASSNEIHKIIKLIDDISFQTNLLSLNASVEAARAGVHGKGFSVVADEVRNLATRSTLAVRESESVIDRSRVAIQDGEKVTEFTVGVFKDLQEHVEQVIGLSENLQSMSENHSTGVHEINDAIHSINDNIQNTAAQVQSVLSGAKDLNSDSKNLMNMVSKFELSDEADGDCNEMKLLE
ncbi:MAG: HAMP domain-containing protein [Candidatus Cloacimonetes bacterium]|nr:HAMP domain-containing protein [Candidatus Cloacimonadota bacterium]